MTRATGFVNSLKCTAVRPKRTFKKLANPRVRINILMFFWDVLLVILLRMTKACGLRRPYSHFCSIVNLENSKRTLLDFSHPLPWTAAEGGAVTWT